MKYTDSEEIASVFEPSSIRKMAIVVHDLCQPLTTLQCRLEMAQIVNNLDDYREAVALGLEECSRMSRLVVELREKLKTFSAAASAVPGFDSRLETANGISQERIGNS